MKSAPDRSMALLLPVVLASCGAAHGPSSPSTVPASVSTMAAASESPAVPLPAEAPPSGRLPSDVLPRRYELTLRVDPARDRFVGAVEIRVELRRPREVIWLHGQNLAVREARVLTARGESVTARYEPVGETGLVALRLARAIAPGTATLRIAYEAPFDPHLQGHYRVSAGGAPYAFTKFEPLSARLAFPCFDEPGFKTPYALTLEVPRGLAALANTRERSRRELPDGHTRITFAETAPLPSYLVAWAVGPFDFVEQTLPATSVRSRALTVRGVATHGRGADLAYALGNVRAIVESLEDYFGVEYPYDKLDLIAAPDHPSGAMENAGAIVFREPYLLLDEAHASEQQRRDVALVLAHEIAHQWFGDMVTMAWWDDLWLNEAFAEWLATRVIDARFPHFAAGLEAQADTDSAMDKDSLASARTIRQPIATVHDVRNAFDGITYVKGAAVLTMFERWLGAEPFRRGVRTYLARHRFGSATADDLLAAFGTAAGRDAATPFRTFLTQTGVPEITARLECAAGAPPRLSLRQGRYLPLGATADRARRWQVPVCARFAIGPGADATREACTLLTEPEGTLALEGATACPAWVHPNAGGSGYYRWSLPPEQLAALARAAEAGALSPAERLDFAGDLRAAYQSGAAGADAVLAALAPLAHDGERLVAAVPMAVLKFARDYVADDAMRPRVESYARGLYAPAYRALGWQPAPNARETGERALARASVGAFVALVARDPAARREGLARGLRYLGVGAAAPAPDAVPAESLETALVLAVQDGGAPAFDALLARLGETRDAALRIQMLRALGSARTAALAARARTLALDPALRGSEVLPVLTAQFAARETRADAWRWYREHFDAVVAKLPAQAAQFTPTLGRFFCDAAHAEELRAFFAPRIEQFVGGPRNLAGTLETVALCEARVRTQGPRMRAFFARSRAVH